MLPWPLDVEGLIQAASAIASAAFSVPHDSVRGEKQSLSVIMPVFKFPIIEGQYSEIDALPISPKHFEE